MVTFFIGVGALVSFAVLLFVLMLLDEIIEGVLHSIDYHQWAVANSKQRGLWNGWTAKMVWAWIKSFLAHVAEFSGMEVGTHRTSSGGGWWSSRGNWRLPDGTKGPNYKPLDF